MSMKRPHYIGIYSIILFVFCFFSPVAQANVKISEIAWMGSDASPNDEWIELYNESDSVVDISGWSITTLDGNILIQLSCTLLPRGVAVLERTDDETVPGIMALTTYTGSLSNVGATIVLKDSNGTIVDEVIGGENWESIGGTNSAPRQTPQRTDAGSWISNTPDPGSYQTYGGAAGNAFSCTVDEETNSEKNEDTVVQQSSGGRSRSSVRIDKNATEDTRRPPIPDELTLRIEGPPIVYVHQPVSLTVHAEGVGKTIIDSLTYRWNFGDTYTGDGKKQIHTFLYPGEYNVVVHGTFRKQDAIARTEIKVLPTTIIIDLLPTGEVVLKNNGKNEIDLHGYTLKGAIVFVFPEFTFLKAGGMLTIPAEQFGRASHVWLHDRKGVSVAEDFIRVPRVDKTAPVVSVTPYTSSSRVSILETIPATEEKEKFVVQNSASSQPSIIRIGKTSDVVDKSVVHNFFEKMRSFFSFF
jgi:hypothetical protein